MELQNNIFATSFLNTEAEVGECRSYPKDCISMNKSNPTGDPYHLSTLQHHGATSIRRVLFISTDPAVLLDWVQSEFKYRSSPETASGSATSVSDVRWHSVQCSSGGLWTFAPLGSKTPPLNLMSDA